MLSQASLDAIEQEMDKYPDDRKQAAIMAGLRIAQNELGWISQDLMNYLADLFDLQPIQVYEVATFYTMYDLEPVGRHKISVCTNVSCMLRGSDDVVEHLQKKLGIKFGETTKDNKYTLREVECLAACGGSPMCQIGKTYHEYLTPEKIDSILDGLE